MNKKELLENTIRRMIREESNTNNLPVIIKQLEDCLSLIERYGKPIYIDSVFGTSAEKHYDLATKYLGALIADLDRVKNNP